MESRKFRIMNHKLGGHMCLTVHCPSCAGIYDAGMYTLEDDQYILGTQQDTVCVHCGAVLPTPLVFVDAGAAYAFLHQVSMSNGVPARLIPKTMLELAHFDAAYLAAAQKRQLH